VDPRTGRTIRSAVIARPGVIALAAGGVFATDFWRHGILRLDPIRHQQTASLKLALAAVQLPCDAYQTMAFGFGSPRASPASTGSTLRAIASRPGYGSARGQRASS
jgi:hypothetical protein